MKYLRTKILLCICILASFSACDHEIFGDKVVDETEVMSGILEVHFEVKHTWIPTDRLIRVGLHVAETSMSIYTGDYLQSAYVTNSASIYSFKLPPGEYYYDAIVACLCGQDSCLIGGFPGSQFSKRHSIGKFEIIKQETTIVNPAFN